MTRRYIVTAEQLTDLKEYYYTDDMKKFHAIIEEVFNTTLAEEVSTIRKEERNHTINEVIEKLTDAIDDRTRTFKGLHTAIKIVDNLRKTPEHHCIGDCDE
jgi:predicted ribosome quality control (RQC) complex YloA/Tae2 family protein